MIKLKYLMLFVAFCLLSSSLQAKVCFLGSNDAACSGASFSAPKICLGCQECTYPRKNATACNCDLANYYKTADCCEALNLPECVYPKTCNNTTDTKKYCLSSKTTLDLATDTAGTIRKSLALNPSVSDDFLSDAQAVSLFTAFCPAENCVCPAKYQYTEDNCASPLVLGGSSCEDSEGKKYTTCSCPSDYKTCSGEYLKGDTTAGTCTEKNGTVKYLKCVCDSAQKPIGYNNWSKTKLNCSDSCATCISDEGTYYSCAFPLAYLCLCGTTTDSNGCTTGCTDSTYDYVGSSYSWLRFLNGSVSTKLGVCGNGPCCTSGYWDNTAYSEQDCATLGYTKTSCTGTALKCPFDTTKVVCLE